MILISEGENNVPLADIALAHWININPTYKHRPAIFQKGHAVAGRMLSHGMKLFKAGVQDWRFFRAFCLNEFALLKRVVTAPAADLPTIIDEVEGLLIKFGLDGQVDRNRIMTDMTAIFGYATWRSNGSGYDLFVDLGNQVCVYCNAVLLIKDDVNKLFGGTYDHYYDKADYPYLNLSLGNLMPSCKPCNETYKKEKFCTVTHFHPHMDDYNASCEFVSDYAPGVAQHQLLITSKIDPDDRRAIYDRDLHILLRYNQPNVLQEAVTIFNVAAEYPENRITELAKEYGKSETEISQITCGKFGIPFLLKEIVNREYGKLRRDLAIQHHLIK